MSPAVEKKNSDSVLDAIPVAASAVVPAVVDASEGEPIEPRILLVIVSAPARPKA